MYRMRNMMLPELTLEQLSTRFHTLEAQVTSLHTQLSQPRQPKPFDYQYVISVGNKRIWSGTDIKTKIKQILQQDPEAEITIGWQTEDPYIHL